MSAATTANGEKFIFGYPVKEIPWERVILIGAFMALITFYSLATENFFTLDNFINVVRRDAWLFFLASGAFLYASRRGRGPQRRRGCWTKHRPFWTPSWRPTALGCRKPIWSRPSPTS